MIHTYILTGRHTHEPVVVVSRTLVSSRGRPYVRTYVSMHGARYLLLGTFFFQHLKTKVDAEKCCGARGQITSEVACNLDDYLLGNNQTMDRLMHACLTFALYYS